MMTSLAYKYDACPCGGHYENRSVEVRMVIKDQVVLLSEVPQGYCPMCGSRVYKAEVLEHIEAVMKGAPVDRGLGGSPTF
jgi:YgiT-type zinc finger domain-containing protein